MPVPIQRPTGGKPWGLLGYLKDFISPPGYVSRGPLGARPAGAAALQGRAPTDAELRAQGYRPLSEEFSAARSAPTDAELRAQGYRPLSEEFSAARQVQPGIKPKPSVQPTIIPAGVVQPTAIVKGLTPAGTVDYSQADEYKSQMAQYRNLIAKEKQQEAEDLGMKIWMEKYGGKLGLTGPNPLMKDGFIPTQGPTPATLQPSEGPLKAFGQEVKTYFPGAGPEGFNPLDAQDQQQAATASQADMATTVKLPVRNRVQAFLQGGM